MTEDEKNEFYMEHVRKLLLLKDVGTPLGALFRGTRQAAQISADEFADLFGISPPRY